MKTVAAVTLFALAIIAFFTGYSNFGIPQIEPAPPPVEEARDLGAMTMEDFISFGESIYRGKGTCTLCHNPVGGRAPLLKSAVATAADRLIDERYTGKAASPEEYIYESLVDPSAYVVAGFGKSGTNDTVSPMPNMVSGSIGLSEGEITAVVAYLQDLGGVEVTVEIPAGVEDEADDDEDGDGAEPRPLFTSAEDIIEEMACGACHKIAGEEGDFGPDLTTIGATRNRDYIRRALLVPNADVAEGYDAEIMPDDYGQQLYALELEMMVDYLAGQK